MGLARAPAVGVGPWEGRTALTRRHALQLAGLAVACASVGGFAVTRSGGAAVQSAPLHLRRSSYLALFDRRFSARTAEGAARRLELQKVVDLGRPGRGQRALAGRDDAFALVFRDGTRGQPPQDLYRLSNPELGSFELMLVPSGDGSRCRAVINRAQGAEAA